MGSEAADGTSIANPVPRTYDQVTHGSVGLSATWNRFGAHRSASVTAPDDLPDYSNDPVPPEESVGIPEPVEPEPDEEETDGDGG